MTPNYGARHLTEKRFCVGVKCAPVGPAADFFKEKKRKLSLTVCDKIVFKHVTDLDVSLFSMPYRQ